MLYDHKRAGDLKPGETLLLFEDGRIEKVKQESPLAPERGDTKDGKEGWNLGGQIFYTSGFSFGIDSEGQTICMGAEWAVSEAIDNPKLGCGDYEIDGIIAIERDIQFKEKETSYGRDNTRSFEAKCRAPKATRRANKRIRPLRYLGHKRPDFRPIKAATKLTLPATQPE